MSDVSLISVKIPPDWNEHKGEKVKFLVFVDEDDKKKQYNYMLRAKRTSGKDYSFSLDFLLKTAIASRTSKGDKIMINNPNVNMVGGRAWIDARSGTEVVTFSPTDGYIYNAKVTGKGETIGTPPVKAPDVEKAKEVEPGEKEVFNVYVLNPYEDWNVSKFDKDKRPTAVKKLTFARTDGDTSILHHNVHVDERVGGNLKAELNHMDSELKRALESFKDGDRIIIKNVTYGWWRFPGASSSRDWIFPTEKTAVSIVPGKIKESRSSIVDKIINESTIN